ncbi:hypothetical protein BY458DRAFT_518794 [Sporodiniella umbellata]|nr:hypothetical protein BY458DRAFT_518794 [Sporodiniella umbellata]
MENSPAKRQKKSFDCQYCEKSYKKESKLTEHERSHTGERPFVCPYPDCNKDYIRSSHLTVHLKKHKNIKDYVCSFEDCKKAFATNQHLQRHQKTHDSPLLECDFPGCFQVFSKRFQLRWHKATHFKEPHECECGSKFSTLPALEKHRARVHENPVLYTCHQCQVEFKKWSELRKHVTKDHPSVCEICKKTYSKQYNLKQHIKDKHTDNKFPCDWLGCTSVLLTKRSYQTHVATVHQQGVQYRCDDCDRGFPYRSMLEKHKRSHSKKLKKPSKEKNKRSVAEQLSGFNRYSENKHLDCPFTDCQYKFNNEYLLRKHLEGKGHVNDVKAFAPNDVFTAV